MKKVLCILLSLLLAASVAMLVGCTENKTDDPNADEPNILPVGDGEESPDPAADKENCIAALTAAANCQPGSAGSSMKTYMGAVALLDWTADTKMTADEFKTVLDSFISGFGSGDFTNMDLAIFGESFTAADEVARQIIAGEYSELDGMAETTSVSLAHTEYDLTVYESFTKLIEDAIAVE